MYKKKTYKIGEYIEIIKYHTYDRKNGGRSKREKPTKEAMQAYNDRQRSKKVQRMILANFSEGDFHMTLSYKKEDRPETMQDAKKELQRFNRKMSAACKKIGVEYKSIYVTERGKQGACHHHMIVNNFPELMQLVRKFWTHGHADYKPLYDEGAFEKLAQYIVKKETKEESEGCSYSHTRNLIIPEPKIEVIHSMRWNLEPKPEKGYEILADSLVNGENPVTGYQHQEYIMRRKKNENRNRQHTGVLQSDKSLGLLPGRGGRT